MQKKYFMKAELFDYLFDQPIILMDILAHEVSISFYVYIFMNEELEEPFLW